MDFNKLTIKSQEAIAAAQEDARRRGNPEIYPEHLLHELVPDAESLRAETEARLEAKPSLQGSSQLEPAAAA